MKNLNQVVNLTAMMFYLSIHITCIGLALVNLLNENKTTAIVAAVAAILLYKPYKQAAERVQKSMGTEHFYHSDKRQKTEVKP